MSSWRGLRKNLNVYIEEIGEGRRQKSKKGQCKKRMSKPRKRIVSLLLIRVDYSGGEHIDFSILHVIKEIRIFQSSYSRF